MALVGFFFAPSGRSLGAGGWNVPREEGGKNVPDIERGQATTVGADRAGGAESLHVVYAGL